VQKQWMATFKLKLFI